MRPLSRGAGIVWCRFGRPRRSFSGRVFQPRRGRHRFGSANYIRGRKAFTQYKNKNSFKKQFKAGVPQGGVLSPTLFNIYMSDLPTPPRDIHVTTYADDITIYSSDKNYTIAQQRLQPYLEDVQTWTKANDLKLNASKTMTTLFTPDPAEYRDELSLQLDNTRLPTNATPKY